MGKNKAASSVRPDSCISSAWAWAWADMPHRKSRWKCVGRPWAARWYLDCAIKGSNKTLEWSLQDKQMMFQISSQLPRFSKEPRQLQCSSNHLGFAQKWVTKGPIKIESVFVFNHIKTCFFFFSSGYDNILNHFKHYQPPRKDGHTNHYFSKVLLFNLFWGW